MLILCIVIFILMNSDNDEYIFMLQVDINIFAIVRTKNLLSIGINAIR